jgi:hypothetical protein
MSFETKLLRGRWRGVNCFECNGPSRMKSRRPTRDSTLCRLQSSAYILHIYRIPCLTQKHGPRACGTSSVRASPSCGFGLVARAVTGRLPEQARALLSHPALTAHSQSKSNKNLYRYSQIHSACAYHVRVTVSIRLLTFKSKQFLAPSLSEPPLRLCNLALYRSSAKH